MSDGSRPRTYVEMDEKTIRHFWRLIGAADMRSHLMEIEERARPIGFNFALAIVEREVAELRVQHTGNILRCVAAAGLDISRYPEVTSFIEGSKPVLFVEEPDLADLAGGGA